MSSYIIKGSHKAVHEVLHEAALRHVSFEKIVLCCDCVHCDNCNEDDKQVLYCSLYQMSVRGSDYCGKGIDKF